MVKPGMMEMEMEMELRVHVQRQGLLTLDCLVTRPSLELRLLTSCAARVSERGSSSLDS